MVKMYYDSSTGLARIRNEKVPIIGYGSQGTLTRSI